VTSALVHHVCGVAGGRSPGSSLGLERPPLARGLLGGSGRYRGEGCLDIGAHGGEMVHDFGVGETDDSDVGLLEGSGSGGISGQAFGRVVLASVEFDHESSRGAIKIWDELTDGSLPQEPNLMAAQKLIPKFAFRRSHSRPQLSSEPCQFPSVRNSRHRKTINNPKSQNPNNPHPQKPSLARGGRSSQRGALEPMARAGGSTPRMTHLVKPKRLKPGERP
jgi:hypothetical protein